MELSLIDWLYDLGQTLMSTVGSTLIDVLSFNIQGFTLVDIMFGAGFLFFIGFVIVKFFIPL